MDERLPYTEPRNELNISWIPSGTIQPGRVLIVFIMLLASSTTGAQGGETAPETETEINKRLLQLPLALALYINTAHWDEVSYKEWRREGTSRNRWRVCVWKRESVQQEKMMVCHFKTTGSTVSGPLYHWYYQAESCWRNSCRIVMTFCLSVDYVSDHRQLRPCLRVRITWDGDYLKYKQKSRYLDWGWEQMWKKPQRHLTAASLQVTNR